MITLPPTFWSQVAYSPCPTGCWEWTGSRHPQGYGQFSKGRGHEKRPTKFAHRLAYLALIGDIPEGLELDHLCVNTPCVNPWHLEPVTRRTNLERGPYSAGKPQAAKTHCPQGHEYSEENTYRWGGMRHCRECGRVRSLARWRRLHGRTV